MKFPQEHHAKELFRNLENSFHVPNPDTTVSVTGAGVHWDCTVSRHQRICVIHCFGLNGPEYLMGFDHEKQHLAMGRTSSRPDVIASAQQWMEGQELQHLHARFGFITELRRSDYDKNLRAGQSMSSFIISQSRRHGLQSGQPHITFRFRENGMDLDVRIDREFTASFPRIELFAEIRSLLNELASQKIG